MRNKTFDCILMKRDAQEKIRAAVAGRHCKAEIEFFCAGADEFEQRIEAARESLTRTTGTDAT